MNKPTDHSTHTFKKINKKKKSAKKTKTKRQQLKYHQVIKCVFKHERFLSFHYTLAKKRLHQAYSKLALIA